MSLNKEEPNTPSDLCTDRKADEHMERFHKLTIKAQARNPKAQPKRATTTSQIRMKKKPINEALAIVHVFKITKKRGQDPFL